MHTSFVKNAKEARFRLRILPEQKMKIDFLKNTENSNCKINNGTKLDNSGALEALYNNSADKLFRVSYQLVGSTEVAEGIVHNVFCDLWKRRKTIRVDVPLEAYVVKAVKYASFHYLKDKVKRENNKMEILTLKPTFHNDTEQQLHTQDLKSEINNLIRLLPNRCQEVFRMSHEKFMSNREIASGLDISEKAVEKHITKALKFLRLGLKKI